MTSSSPLTPKQRRIEWAVIFAFWTFLAALMVVNRILDARGPSPDPHLISFEIFRFYLWAVLTLPIFWLTHRLSLDETNWPWRLPLHLGLAFLFGFALDLITDLIRFYVIRPPWTEGTTFNPLEDLFALDFLFELTSYLGILAAGFARSYFLRYQERQRQTSELKAQLAQARLETLRMQINPHFLFNTLHAISSLVERDPKGVRRIIARLSSLLRYTLEDSSRQEVPLREELQFLDGYLEIQQIRFQDYLEIEQNIDQDVLDALVPNLILQPLVENAIKHGVAPTMGPGRITIEARRVDEWLELIVSDNGPGLPPDGLSEDKGLGLKNVETRLEGLYGDQQELILDSPPHGGVTARILLPFHSTTDLRTRSVEPV
jgi:LytS/YehU family sensor histidine kinase